MFVTNPDMPDAEQILKNVTGDQTSPLEAEKVPYDYIIIGAGSAGCLLANRLSRQHSVLVLEAGKTDEYLWIHVPVGYLYCINNPRTDWMYKTQPSAGLNGRTLLYPRGKVLGGSSSINGMIYMRGQSHNYDSWAQAGNRGWAWADCLPAFKQHEAYHGCKDGAADEFHGADGEWTVSKQRVSWKVLDSFKAAALQYGLPDTPDFNRGDNIGVGYFEVNQQGGWRLNTSKAFLRPIFARQKLQVYVNSPVQKLLFNDANDPKRCTGVVIEHLGELQTLRANKEIILCAGAVASPAILERSGVGQAARLQALGIAVVHDLAGVGENLQDHLQIRCVYKVKHAATLNTRAAHWWGKAWMGLQFLLTRTGPLSMAPSQLGAFAKSSPEQAHANVQFHVQPLSLEAFGQPLHSFDAMTVSVSNLQPTSRGSVHIRSADMHAAPDITPNYLATSEDKKVAADSIRLARSIMGQDAMQGYSPEEFKPGVQLQTDDALIKAAGDIASTIFHPVGTCKMGPSSDSMAVVNDRLQVHGLKNVRVVDASIMPTITSGNTNAPTLMIAEKAAAWMLAGE